MRVAKRVDVCVADAESSDDSGEVSKLMSADAHKGF